MRRGSLLALLGVLVVGGFAAWWIFGASRPRDLPATVPTDDLELVAALLDGAASEPPHDRLVAGPTERYLARASDRTIVAVAGTIGEGGVPRDAGASRTLAILGAPARGMALAGGALWVTTGHAIEKIPVTGGEPQLIASSLSRPGPIAADGASIFVVDAQPASGGMTRANLVLRLPASGGESTEIGRSEGEVTNLAVDEANVYWADRLEGTVVAVPKTGGTPRLLASDRGLPGDVAVDADAVYWVEKRSESLWTVPKTGGAPRQLAQDFAGFANVIVDPRGVVWTNEAAVDGEFRVLTVPRAGGDISAVSRAVDAVDALASDGAHLYWERDGTVTTVETR